MDYVPKMKENAKVHLHCLSSLCIVLQLFNYYIEYHNTIFILLMQSCYLYDIIGREAENEGQSTETSLSKYRVVCWLESSRPTNALHR